MSTVPKQSRKSTSNQVWLVECYYQHGGADMIDKSLVFSSRATAVEYIKNKIRGPVVEDDGAGGQTFPKGGYIHHSCEDCEGWRGVGSGYQATIRNVVGSALDDSAWLLSVRDDEAMSNATVYYSSKNFSSKHLGQKYVETKLKDLGLPSHSKEKDGHILWFERPEDISYQCPKYALDQKIVRT